MVWLVVGWCCRLHLVDDASYKGEWEGRGGCERLGGGMGRSVIWTCRQFPPIIRARPKLERRRGVWQEGQRRSPAG